MGNLLLPAHLLRSFSLATGLLFVTLFFASSSAIAQQTGSSSSSPTQVASAAKTVGEADLLTRQLSAIAEAKEDDVASNALGPNGVIPTTKGFNLSLATSSQHDAAGGWSNVLSPTIAYRFDRHFAIDAGVSTYPYINVVQTTSKKGAGGVTKTVSSLETKRFLLSDTTLGGEFDAHANVLDYNLTATVAFPTGDQTAGLGAGQVTYAFVNHFEHPFGDYVTPDIELGIDDSPNLLTPRVKKSYLVVGTNAHFQAGFDISLPHNIEFETDAYEELPLGSVVLNSTTVKGKKGKIITVPGTPESVGEDNGFTNTLDIPLNPHVALSGFYNRSLRNHDDTAGFSFTFLLRGQKKEQATR
jgi:hypothetical protein